jgi:hypothetical protein
MEWNDGRKIMKGFLGLKGLEGNGNIPVGYRLS